MSKYLGSAFLNEVRLVLLAGLSTATSTAITAADSILVALGKLQAQVTLRATAASPSFTGTVGGSADFSAVTALSAGSTARSLSTRFADIFNVKDFGATGNGTTDDTTAIQSCITSASSRPVWFPQGTYKVTSTLTVSAYGATIFGAGRGVTFIAYTGTTQNLFTIAGPRATVYDLTITAPTTATGGYLLFFTDSTDATISRVYLDGGYSAIGFGGAGSNSLACDSVLANFKDNGIEFSTTYIGVGRVNNVNMVVPGSNAGNGVLLQTGDTFTLENMNIQGCFFGVLMKTNTNGNYLANVFATNVLCDGSGRHVSEGGPGTGGDGWCIDNSATGTGPNGIATYLQRVFLTNCWGGYEIRDGFRVTGAVTVTMVNCIAILNQGHGFNLQTGSSEIRVEGSVATGNSYNNSNTNSGINVENGCSLFYLMNNRSGQQGSGISNTQRFGIVVGNPESNYMIVGNNTQNNASAGLSDSGGAVTKVVANNL